MVNKLLFSLLAAVLISFTGTLWADDAAPAASDSSAQPASADKPAAMAAKPAEAKPDHSIRAQMKAAGELAEAGKTEEAIAAYEKIGELPSKKGESWRLNSEGLAYLTAKDPMPDKAIPYLEKAVAADENNAVAWNNLGSAYEQTDQLKKAADAYQKSIDAAKADGGSDEKAQANLDALKPKLDKMASKNGGDETNAGADSAAPADKNASTDSDAAGANASK